jgi:ABC-type branched-subunit amino acid transport system ATPase component
MLQVNALNQFYGGSHILRDVSFEVPHGKLTTLLGRNGVGKSTLLKCLMGVVPTRSGSISWDGKALEKKAPYERVSAGLAYVPQGREIFPRLTVEENLLIGAASRGKPSGVPDRIYRVVSGAAHDAPAPRRRPVRRPAAAAGHRPGADERAAVADPRRADRGHPAVDHPGHRPRLRCWSTSSA